jgi:hypothetical protein
MHPCQASLSGALAHVRLASREDSPAREPGAPWAREKPEFRMSWPGRGCSAADWLVPGLRPTARHRQDERPWGSPVAGAAPRANGLSRGVRGCTSAAARRAFGADGGETPRSRERPRTERGHLIKYTSYRAERFRHLKNNQIFLNISDRVKLIDLRYISYIRSSLSIMLQVSCACRTAAWRRRT